MATGIGEEEVKRSAISYAKTWGESSVSPIGLATFVFALHSRPPQFLPLTFVPVLVGSSYLNLNGHTVDSAGITAAWSGLYFLLANRRKPSLREKFKARGIIRGVSMGFAAVNVACCGLVYAVGKRSVEEED